MVDDPADVGGFSDALDGLLDDPEYARALGRAGGGAPSTPTHGRTSRTSWRICTNDCWQERKWPLWPRPHSRVSKSATFVSCGAVAASIVVAGVLVDRLLAAHAIVAGGFVLLAAAYLVGTFSAGSPLFGRVVRGRIDRPEVALTFEDGPDPRFTPTISATLARRGHRGTFFVLGARARDYPHVLSQVSADGHNNASHGDDHRMLAFSPPATVRAQVELAERAVESVLGGRTGAFLLGATRSAQPVAGLCPPAMWRPALRVGRKRLRYREPRCRDDRGPRREDLAPGCDRASARRRRDWARRFPETDGCRPRADTRRARIAQSALGGDERARRGTLGPRNERGRFTSTAGNGGSSRGLAFPRAEIALTLPFDDRRRYCRRLAEVATGSRRRRKGPSPGPFE